ncbi:YceI-like domain protein [Oerskovia enterophila]|uniref:YceI-like domain protein n=2 Tax=Oerskovia enterophila TaxID=43678 RepID=A0ABX2Y1J1_9CELL|nr:YceI-like domain protein [Oerskovia enterophila]
MRDSDGAGESTGAGPDPVPGRGRIRGMSRGARWILVAIVAALVIVLAGPYVVARLSAGTAPPPLGLQTPGETISPTATPDPGPFNPDGTWVVGAGSQAGYRVDEVLSGEKGTVVGRTDEVGGTLVVTDGELVRAEITVKTGSIASSSVVRDDAFRRLLETDVFPDAVFILTEPVDLEGVEEREEPLTVQARGTLTIRDVTEPVTVTLEARRSGDGVQVSGAIPVTFVDYGVHLPELPFVTVEPSGTVEMLLELERVPGAPSPAPTSP